MYAGRLSEALPAVRERLAAAQARAGRTGPVELVAVTKGHPTGAAVAAAAAGLRICGENRVQELAQKVAELPELPVAWHLIGHLQRNKVRQALGLCALIHSIDSVRLARELSAEAERRGAAVRGLVQINVSGEATKGGFGEQDALAALAQIVELPWLRVEGLMTMAPFGAPEPVLRDVFGRTRRLLERCRAAWPGRIGAELSMGMSDDFEVAVEEGSTMVRLGTVLFGERAQ
jgi:PLP dependent protein